MSAAAPQCEVNECIGLFATVEIPLKQRLVHRSRHIGTDKAAREKRRRYLVICCQEKLKGSGELL
jgi:hypothetical protein